jgi:general secretion pathway protein G
MILQNRSRSISRRSAFTLLEVLVVVAIILVLASVATVAVLQIQEDNKDSMAKMNAVNLSKAVQMFMLKHESKPNGWEDVMRYIEGQDPAKLTDPWGGQYQIGYTVTDTGLEVPYVFTVNPKTQETIRSDAKH